MKRGTPDHPKTLALQSSLKCSRAEAVGLLELLWHWTARYAPAGDVGRWPNGALAQAVGWDGGADQFVAALVAAGWLDEREDCRLYVHDWSHHADDAVKLALYRAVKTFADGTVPVAHRLSAKERERLEQLWAQRAHNVPTPCAQPEPRQSPALAPPEPTATDSGDASRPGPKRPRKLPIESASAVKEACDDWTELLGGTAPGSRIAGAWPGLLKLAPWAEVRPVWRWYLAEGKRSGKAEFCNPQDFASKFDYWKARSLGLTDPERWRRMRQQVESAVDVNAEVLKAVEQGRL